MQASSRLVNLCDPHVGPETLQRASEFDIRFVCLGRAGQIAIQIRTKRNRERGGPHSAERFVFVSVFHGHADEPLAVDLMAMESIKCIKPTGPPDKKVLL